MANNIRNQIRKRRRHHKKAKQTNTEHNWAKFRKQRNYVIELIRNAKNNYENISIRLRLRLKLRLRKNLVDHILHDF